MEENKEILLPSKRYKKAEEQDLTLQVNLESSESLMRLGDRDIVLDLEKLFNKERQDSIDYKIYGKMKMIFRNMYSGDTPYDYLSENLYLAGDGVTGIGNATTFTGFLPYDELAFLRRDLHRQVNTPASGTTVGFNSNLSYTGPTGHTTISTMMAPYHNWNLYLSYVYSGDSNYHMTYTLSGVTKTEGNNIIHFKAGDGIPFRVSYTVGNYYELTSPIEHGMKQGEYITLSGVTFTGAITGRTYQIDSVGNEFYDSEKYVINLSKSSFKPGITIGTSNKILFTGKRVLDVNNITNTTSSYYVHKHKTLTDSSHYIMDNVGFESPIFENEKKIIFENSAGVNDVLVERNRPESVLFDFKEPFQLTSELKNNLGYTPTEIYLTTIFRNGNGYFNYPPKVGHKFNFHNSWIDNHFSGTTSNESTMGNGTTFTRDSITFTSGNTLPIGTVLTGAFVEYNPKELKERIICEAFQKITNPTTIFDYGQTGNVDGFSGATVNNSFGLHYQPHHRIKLRQLSPYIENSDTKDVYNIPENKIYDSQEKLWRYRDLYDHGYVDVDGNGTDFPFINGQHYVKADINFYLRNERYYTNKADGLINFLDSNNQRNNTKGIC
jgi:hypothetical protein